MPTELKWRKIDEDALSVAAAGNQGDVNGVGVVC
jgi:hypothetical protein